MSIMKNLNYIQELNRFPCALPSPFIVVKTAFVAAPPALLKVALPGCSEIIAARAGYSPHKSLDAITRPAIDGLTRPRRGGRHGKKVGGVIEQIIPPTPWGGRQFAYFFGYSHIQRLLYFWLIADVTTDFIATWTTLIYQEQECELPGNGFAVAKPGPWIFPPSEGHIPMSAFDQDIGVTQDGFRIIVKPGINASIGWQVDWEVWPPGTPTESNISVWLQQVPGDMRIGYSTMNDPLQKNHNINGGAHYHKWLGGTGDTRYQLRYSNPGPTAMRIKFAEVYASTTGRQSAGIAWGCAPKPVEWPFP